MATPSKGGGKAMLFDFGWSEIMLITVVALVVIGPKDLPRAMRAAGYWIRKARSLSQELQGHVDDMMREAELSEIHEGLKKVTEIDLGRQIEGTIDPEGTIREGLTLPEPEGASSAQSDDAALEAPEHIPEEASQPLPLEAPQHVEEEALPHLEPEARQNVPQEAAEDALKAADAPHAPPADGARKEAAVAAEPPRPPLPAEGAAAPKP